MSITTTWAEYAKEAPRDNVPAICESRVVQATHYVRQLYEPGPARGAMPQPPTWLPCNLDGVMDPSLVSARASVPLGAINLLEVCKAPPNDKSRGIERFGPLVWLLAPMTAYLSRRRIPRISRLYKVGCPPRGSPPTPTPHAVRLPATTRDR